MADAPGVINKGTVVGFFSTIGADSDDVGGQVDETPVSGVITCTPSVSTIQIPTASPPRRSGVAPVQLQVIDGYIGGTPAGTNIMASSQPGAVPNFIQWTATFQLEGTPNPATLLFEVPIDGVIDLSQAVAVTPLPGISIVYATTDPNGVPTFISATDPKLANPSLGKYIWYDISQPEMTIWIEDGT